MSKEKSTAHVLGCTDTSYRSGEIMMGLRLCGPSGAGSHESML